MKTIFISDLHLDEQLPKAIECFERFIKTEVTSADVLYILGDLFEAWIGDDEKAELHCFVAQQLSSLNMPIYFIHGNRDFLISTSFAKAAKMQLLPDPCVIELYGKKALISHGDLFCTSDIQYQRFRKIVHKPLLQKLFLALPLSWRGKIAARMRQGSQQHTGNTALNIMDVAPEAIDQAMAEHQTDLLIHGHTHRPAIHTVPHGQRIVLGAWHSQGNALIYTDRHEAELIYF